MVPLGFLPRNFSQLGSLLTGTSSKRASPETRFLPKQDSPQNGKEIGRNPVLEGIPLWEESQFGRNPVSGGILFCKESQFGRNPVSGGILFCEESQFGRNPNLGGIPFREESPFGRNPRLGGVYWEESRLGGVPRPPYIIINLIIFQKRRSQDSQL